MEKGGKADVSLCALCGNRTRCLVLHGLASKEGFLFLWVRKKEMVRHLPSGCPLFRICIANRTVAARNCNYSPFLRRFYRDEYNGSDNKADWQTQAG